MIKKRKVKDEPIILDQYLLPKLQETMQEITYPYKNNTAQLQLRDQALTAFYILTGCRNTEHQQIRKKQTRNYSTHILIVNIQPCKRGNLRPEIILPKKGGLAPFTQKFEMWLQHVPTDESILFPAAKPDGSLNWNKPLSRERVHRIIKTTTGLFPHWFRGVCETIYGKQIFKNDAWALKDFMGLVNLDSTSSYVSGQWEKYKGNVYKAK